MGEGVVGGATACGGQQLLSAPALHQPRSSVSRPPLAHRKVVEEGEVWQLITAPGRHLHLPVPLQELQLRGDGAGAAVSA